MNRKPMTLKELSAYLQLSRSTLYQLAQTGKIPALKIGGVWRFHPDLVDRWLANQRTTGRIRAKQQEIVHGKNGSR